MRALLLLLALAGSGSVLAQALYKWVDAQGKVQYSDQPPKNFKGEVQRIEPDVQPLPAAPYRPPVAPNSGPKAVPATDTKEAGDFASRRRATRDRLTADLDRARAQLETARKALAGDAGPGVDERQVVRQTFAKGTQPATPRSNCREMVDGKGKKSLMCPALVPGEAYYERMRQLEEAVKRAELEVELAERAYRRGVD